MSLVEFRSRVDVETTPERAFDYFADYRHVAAVLEGVSRWEPLSEKKTKGVGARYSVEMLACAAEPHQPRNGQMQKRLGSRQRDQEVVEPHDRVHFVVDNADVGRNVACEQRARHDFERELHHRGGYIELLSFAPALAHRGCTVDHRVGVGLDALAMECRCCDSALAHVELAFAGYQPFAEQDLHSLLRALFDEGRGLGDEDFADQIRIVDKDDVAAAEFVVRDVAVFAYKVLEQQDGIARFEEAVEEIERQIAREAGGKSILRFAVQAAHSLSIRCAGARRQLVRRHRL